MWMISDSKAAEIGQFHVITKYIGGYKRPMGAGRVTRVSTSVPRKDLISVSQLKSVTMQLDGQVAVPNQTVRRI